VTGLCNADAVCLPSLCRHWITESITHESIQTSLVKNRAWLIWDWTAHMHEPGGSKVDSHVILPYWRMFGKEYIKLTFTEGREVPCALSFTNIEVTVIFYRCWRKCALHDNFSVYGGDGGWFRRSGGFHPLNETVSRRRTSQYRPLSNSMVHVCGCSADQALLYVQYEGSLPCSQKHAAFCTIQNWFHIYIYHLKIDF